MNPARPLSPATLAVTAGRPSDVGDPLNPPIVLASNFRGGPEYARTHGTSTWAALEQAVGALDGGQAVSFSSGMAAASALFYACKSRVVVLPSGSYMGVRALAAELAERNGMELRMVDITDTTAVLAAAAGADLVWLESPTNPTLEEADLATILAACQASGIRTVVDATFATPLRLQPLKLGATAVLHSGTKFIGGHSDLIIGLTVTGDPDLYTALVNARMQLGATPGALEAYLALRGLRTLAVRLDRSTATAEVLAARLREHPGVTSARQAGAMVSFVVHGDALAADAVVVAVELIVAATSLGGVETTMERRQKYAGDALVPPGLIRMSVGLEDIEDLWADLTHALGAAETPA
jgi:cystathionine gamma-synthase